MTVSKRPAWKRYLHELLHEVIEWQRRSWFGTYELEVLECSREHVVFLANGRRVIADKQAGDVRARGRVLARFDDIESIVLYSHYADKPHWYAVRLNIAGRPNRFIGRARNEIDAAIAAARLSTVTGKEIISLI